MSESVTGPTMASSEPNQIARVPTARVSLAVAVALLWTGFLIWQVVTQANPVLFSRPQVLAAPLIVEGVVTDDGSIRVESVPWGDAEQVGSTIAIADLPKIATPGTRWIVPLMPLDNGFTVFPGITEWGLARWERTARIYPPTAQARLELERLLAGRANSGRGRP